MVRNRVFSPSLLFTVVLSYFDPILQLSQELQSMTNYWSGSTNLKTLQNPHLRAYTRMPQRSVVWPSWTARMLLEGERVASGLLTSPQATITQNALVCSMSPRTNLRISLGITVSSTKPSLIHGRQSSSMIGRSNMKPGLLSRALRVLPAPVMS